MVQCVSILGSTGSIGRQSLDIIRRLPGIRVAALTAGTNVERMAQQCREFSPKLAVMATQEAAQALAHATGCFISYDDQNLSALRIAPVEGRMSIRDAVQKSLEGSAYAVTSATDSEIVVGKKAQ